MQAGLFSLLYFQPRYGFDAVFVVTLCFVLSRRDQESLVVRHSHHSSAADFWGLDQLALLRKTQDGVRDEGSTA